MSILKDAYDKFVRSNAGWYLPLLDSASSLTIFMPGRFNESEVKSEAIYASINLLQTYHNAVLGRPRPDIEVKCGDETKLIRRIKNLLTFLHITQVLFEVTARRLYGDKAIRGSRLHDPRRKWIVIALIEITKALCRLKLLANNNGKMLTHYTPLESQIVADRQQSLAKLREVEAKVTEKKPLVCLELRYMYALHGRGAHPHGRFAIPPPHPRDRRDAKASTAEVIAEALYIIRPVLYVLARLKCGESAWRPWLLSLFTDIASRMLMTRYGDLSPSQQKEMARRTSNYALYLLRSPFFDKLTVHPINAISKALGKLPLVGPAFESVGEIAHVLQSLYFYTSAS